MDIFNDLNCLSPVSDRWQRLFRENGNRKNYPKGTFIWGSGDTMREALFVEKGNGKCQYTNINGEQFLFYYFSAGSVIGEGTLLNRQSSIPHSELITPTDFYTLTDCEVYQLSYPKIQSIIQAHSDLQIDLFNCLLNKMSLSGFSHYFRTYSTLDRIALFLFATVLYTGHRELALTQNNLAASISAHPVSVSKELQKLEDRGILFKGYRKMLILDWKGLQSYVKQSFEDDLQIYSISTRLVNALRKESGS